MTNNYFNPFFTVKTMDGLFISNQTATKDQEFIANNKFGLIVNTCPLEFKVPPIPNVYKVMNFHWQNSRGNMIDTIDIKTFRPIFDEIGKCLEEGQGVLIVSDRGHSRAITFVLLYLMSRFDWELFKALEYINSRRENLEVRAAYLKLLVNYEKSLKNSSQQCSSLSNSEPKKPQLSSNPATQQIGLKTISSKQIKQSMSQSNDKWCQSRIKSPEQQLLSNTFKNTIKKRKINELNQEYRQILMKEMREDKKLQGNNKSNTSKDWNRKVGNSSMNKGEKGKGKKNVKFSNEIEIIIKQSAVTQIFPQYEQLSGDYLFEQERQSRVLRQEQVESIHSYSANHQSGINNGLNLQRIIQAKQKEPLPLSKKETVPSVTNSRMINIRKMERVSSGLGNRGNIASQNITAHKSASYNQMNGQENEFIILNSSEDSYSNELELAQAKKQQVKLKDLYQQTNSSSNLIEGSKSSSLKNQQKKQAFFLKQPFTKTQTQLKQPKSKTKINQTSTNFNTQQLLNYQIRPSSLKKFKPIFIDQKYPKASSPKKERKDQRILTEPKYDHEFDNPTLQQNTYQKSRRRLSASIKEDETFNYNKKPYQHKKSASTTMAIKMMNRFQKKSSTPIKSDKQYPTPQIIAGETQRELRSSSHNNFFTRPLSRGGSNSLKMTTKKSVTSSFEEQSVNRHQKQSPTVFNVNINVNIGKLEMFGTKNKESRQSISRSSVNTSIREAMGNNRDRQTKANSNIDKSQLLYNKIRSNSSNENSTKFSVSSTSIAERQGDRGDRITSQKLMGKEGLKVNDHHYNDLNRKECIANEGFSGDSALINEDDNIFASDSFAKKDIMEKINRKLLKNSRNSKLEDHTKKTSVLQNNFV